MTPSFTGQQISWSVKSRIQNHTGWYIRVYYHIWFRKALGYNIEALMKFQTIGTKLGELCPRQYPSQSVCNIGHLSVQCQIQRCYFHRFVYTHIYTQFVITIRLFWRRRHATLGWFHWEIYRLILIRGWRRYVNRGFHPQVPPRGGVADALNRRQPFGEHTAWRDGR